MKPNKIPRFPTHAERQQVRRMKSLRAIARNSAGRKLGKLGRYVQDKARIELLSMEMGGQLPKGFTL